MNKKKGILMLPFLLLSLGLHAQIILGLLFGDKLNNERMEFGLGLGMNFSNLIGINGDQFRGAFCFGLYSSIEIGNSGKWTVNPKLFFKYTAGARGLKIPLPPEYLGNPVDTNNVSASLSYYSLPITLNYWFNKNWSVGLGPQIGYLGNAKHIYPNGDDNLTLKVKSQYNDFDAGLTASINFKLMKEKGLNIGLSYYYGFTNVVRDNGGSSVKNMSFQFLVGIPMGKAK